MPRAVRSLAVSPGARRRWALADTQGSNVASASSVPWDPTNKAVVRANCCANGWQQRLGRLFDQRLGTNAFRFWNSLDVVPLVWNVVIAQAIYQHIHQVLFGDQPAVDE
jgi:hypothetical protein